MAIIHSQLTGVHYVTHAQTGRLTACNSVDKGTNALYTSIPTIQFAVIATVQLVCMYVFAYSSDQKLDGHDGGYSLPRLSPEKLKNK